MREYTEKEKTRQAIQQELDCLKTADERNVLGQFATPIDLAMDILEYAKKIITNRSNIKFLDPAFGTGAFYSALISVFNKNELNVATGFEIDQHYGQPAKKLWADGLLNLKITDFTKEVVPIKDEDKYNLIICNPPYIRHHHIKHSKEWLQKEALRSANIKLSGLSGFYCYYMALCQSWMQTDGIAGWLIPSEFMDVNYGQAIKEYLLNEVTLVQIHRFDPKDLQFDDALVSSTIVWFKNSKPNKNDKVKFSYGGTLGKPLIQKDISKLILSNEKKWSRFPLANERVEHNTPLLSDFFTVKRGIASGDNDYFILSVEEIMKRNLPLSQFRPILPSPRFLKEDVIKSNEDDFPILDKQLFVLDCKLKFSEIKFSYPDLHEYLQLGIKNGVPDRYLCKNRKLWYAQENRLESNFYCTYIGRTNADGKNPFRFILNHSKSIVTNSYLILYPKPLLQSKIKTNPKLLNQLIEALNKITTSAMIEEGRVYGGGMYKLEPSELSKVPAKELSDILLNKDAASITESKLIYSETP
jgi:adenine-specific DNA-methyltransferase